MALSLQMDNEIDARCVVAPGGSGHATATESSLAGSPAKGEHGSGPSSAAQHRFSHDPSALFDRTLVDVRWAFQVNASAPHP